MDTQVKEVTVLPLSRKDKRNEQFDKNQILLAKKMYDRQIDRMLRKGLVLRTM